MDVLAEGKTVFIESYKHNGSFHRAWSKAFVIETNDKWTVAVTDHTWVVESDGRRWLTKEPAVCFFYKDHWFNIISMIRKSGIYYYCNLASPSLFDGEAIKNIDYDLDVKLYPDNSYQILDEGEYAMHAKQMNYPPEVMQIVEHEMQKLIDSMDKGEDPFNQDCIESYYHMYQKMNRQSL